jgi:transposase
MKKHLRVLGIDIAKQMFHVVGMDDTGTIGLRKRLPRGALMPFMAQLSPVVIGMEACGGKHGQGLLALRQFW